MARVILLILVVAAAGAVVFVALPASRSCTVARAGSDVSITVEGPDAGMTCDSHVATAGGEGWYRLDGGEQASGSLTCRINRGDLTIEVRDSGMHLLGSQLCAGFTPSP